MSVEKTTTNKNSSSVRGRVWLTFHLWTVAAIALLLVGNVATALRPFEDLKGSATTPTRAPLITISSTSIPSDRQPASDLDTSESSDYLADVQLGCDVTKKLTVPTDVRQLRLRITDCRDSKSGAETFYIRNETNGFEATIFKMPDTRKPAAADLISTDYISLENGDNKIRISRSQGQAPSRDQTLEIHRR